MYPASQMEKCPEAYGKAGPGEVGSVMTWDSRVLDGQVIDARGSRRPDSLSALMF